MTPERLQQIEDLYYSALDLAPAERGAFIERSCDGDEELHREVTSLLASYEQADDFIESPVYEAAARLIADQQERSMVGRQIGRHKIVELLGAGGMGQVYLAEDTSLGRRVALKLLPSYFTRETDRLRRFRQEARNASGLNHPNIITIHEIGAENGTYFIATEFIEGETLRQRMTTARLSLAEAVEIATQVAAALEAAHEAKIVHRDIKPENIMIRRRDGYVKVLDFGLAKLTEKEPIDSEVTSHSLTRTEAGVILGTAAYMSPEQARGLRVDARTDLWSLGVVLYEMLSGYKPFTGETAEDVRASILKDPLPPLPSETPDELEKIVEKALRKDRAERYRTANLFLSELRNLQQQVTELNTKSDHSVLLRSKGARPAIGDVRKVTETSQEPAIQTSVMTLDTRLSIKAALGTLKGHKLVVALALAVLVITVAVTARPFIAWWLKPSSIAILPMVNATGDPNNNYLADGLTESLITSLNQINEPGRRPRLLVTAQGTVLLFKGKEIDPRSVGRELGVDAVVASQMIEQNGLWIIKVEMVNVANGSAMWRQQYSIGQRHVFDELMKTQDALASDVAGKLPLTLSDAERQRLTRRYTQNPAAYDAYLKGRAFWFKTTPEGYRKSIEYYQQAIDLDPNFPLPYWGMGLDYVLQAKIGIRPYKDATEKAIELYLKALRIDSTLRGALGAMELAEMELWNWEAIEKAGPRHLGYHFAHGGYLIAMGRLDEQLAYENRILGFDSHSPLMNFSYANTLYLARQYDAALTQYQKTLNLLSALPPEYSSSLVDWTHSGLGQVYLQKGMFQEAISEFNSARDLTEDLSPAWEELGYAYARSGQRDEAIKILNQLQDRARRGEYILPLGIAWIYIGLRDHDQAFVWLEKSFEERSDGMREIKTNPIYDPLRSDARFTSLLQRMKLPA